VPCTSLAAYNSLLISDFSVLILPLTLSTVKEGRIKIALTLEAGGR
jgi:hypothetical protein